MVAFLNLNKKFFILLFFLAIFLIGIFVFPDYGISIDEDNTRIIGFLTLESILKIFAPEHIAKVSELISGITWEIVVSSTTIPNKPFFISLLINHVHPN